MIAYHYPPVLGSSGVHRTVGFARSLRSHGWQSQVLTVKASAYAHTDNTITHLPGVEVHRAQCWDTARDLSIAGKYPGWLALPDRWISWFPFAVMRALRIVRRTRPSVIWSTYPIASAHLIGAAVHRLTGIPWIADFRDSMHDDLFPYDAQLRRIHTRLERTFVRRATHCVFTTNGTRKLFAARYPREPEKKWSVIENGYDEAAFDGLVWRREDAPGRRLRLVHSGILYPEERDPSAFFKALSTLLNRDPSLVSRLSITLRATGHDVRHFASLQQFGLQELVTLAPAVPYREALQEMVDADGLLLFQAANCNHQIPAKLYEYLRAGRPILAMTDSAGDTAAVIESCHGGRVAPLDDAKAIEKALPAFIEQISHGQAPIASREAVQNMSRATRTQAFVSCLDELVV